MAGYFLGSNYRVNLESVRPEVEVDLFQVSLKKSIAFLIDSKSGIDATDDLRRQIDATVIEKQSRAFDFGADRECQTPNVTKQFGVEIEKVIAGSQCRGNAVETFNHYHAGRRLTRHRMRVNSDTGRTIGGQFSNAKMASCLAVVCITVKSI